MARLQKCIKEGKALLTWIMGKGDEVGLYISDLTALLTRLKPTEGTSYSTPAKRAILKDYDTYYNSMYMHLGKLKEDVYLC